MAFNKWKYDVFLSFRGEDTRNNFVAHLHKGMLEVGIGVFKDDVTLERGKFITPELLKSIEESRFLVIIFSKNYASSTWCLDELTKIMECVDAKKGQEALPIFYDVDPSDVRWQKNSFDEAMTKHKATLKGRDLKKVQRWTDALRKAASISGWDVRKTANGDETKCIELIVNKINNSMERTISSIGKHLVGIECRVKEVKSSLNVQLSGVLFLGIWGMGGIGKTTVAKAVFDEISYQFQGSCFLANIREVSKKHGPEHLQKKLLSQIMKQHSLNVESVSEGAKMLRRKKVLIVLDDVDDDDQLDCLVGNRDWFGNGSRIITTTRNKDLLRKHDKLYHVLQLAIHDALELFSWHAFQQGTPHKGFEELSTSVVNYASGLPLALVVLGSFFYKLGLKEWISALARLKNIGDGKIVKQLSLSLDGLSHEDRDIFLDIACFFRGKKKDDVITTLNSFGFESEIGIHILIGKSLLYISDGMVEMHDLIEQMGQQVASYFDRDQPWKHSRLLRDKDVETVFSKNLWTESIKGIMVPIGSDRHICKWSEAFRNMPCLRLLIVKGDEARHYDPVADPVEYFPSSLKWLDWSYYSFESLPKDFEPQNLAGLHMTYSSLVKICKEPKTFDKLAILNLSFSEKLLQTPDFSETPHLQRVILKGCVSLIKVHQSLGNLRKLIFLNMGNCKNLKFLLSSIQMESLESLNLSGCEKLEKFPEIQGNMELLSELTMARTAIQELPSSIGRLIGINLLDLSSCGNLVTLPPSLCEMKKLNILNLKGCSKLATFPDNLCDLDQLEEINAGKTAIWQLPDSFGNLGKLRILSLKKGSNLIHHQSAWRMIFPKSFGSLKELRILDLSGCNLCGEEINALSSLTSLLELNLSRNKFISLPDSIRQLSQLQYLNLAYCSLLTGLPKLPPTIQELYVEDFLATEAISALPMYPDLHLVSFTNYTFDQQPYTEKSDNNSLLDTILLDTMNNVVDPSLKAIVFPEYVIPSWFAYQSSEEKISFELPKFWWCEEFEGFAICCVTRMGVGIRDPDSQLSGKYDYTLIKAKLSSNNDQEELQVLEQECKVGTASRKYSWCVCFAYIPLCSLLVRSGTEVRNFDQYGVFEASIQRGVTRLWGVHLNYKRGLQSSYNTSTIGISASSSSTELSRFPAAASDDSSCLSGEILPAPNLKKYRFTDENFRPGEILGEGSFGIVFKGWVDEKMLIPTKVGSGVAVAVRMLNSESMQGFEEWREWQAEVNFLGRLSHPNLVKLLGYCWEEKKPLLIYEFMQNRSLEFHLFRRSTAIEPLSWNLWLKIAIGAARGLAFLHFSEKQIIYTYREFKASNILLDGNYHAKLSGFGLGKVGPSARNSRMATLVMGSYGYAAPEYMATGHLSVKGDVYGFGVVLLEILTGLRVLDMRRPSGQHNLVDWVKPMLSHKGKLKSIIDARMKGQYSSNAATFIAQLTLKCLEVKPNKRPSMNEVVGYLEQVESMR